MEHDYKVQKYTEILNVDQFSPAAPLYTYFRFKIVRARSFGARTFQQASLFDSKYEKKNRVI